MTYIKDEPLIFLHRTYQPEEIIEHFYTQIGRLPHVKHRSGQLSTIQGMVKEGFGCSIQMEDTIDDGVHVIARPLLPSIKMEICLAWNERIPHGRAFHEFLDLVKSLEPSGAFDAMDREPGD